MENGIIIIDIIAIQGYSAKKNKCKKYQEFSMCIVSGNNLLPKQDVARNQVVVAIKCCSKYCQNLYDYCHNCGNIAAFRAWCFWPQIYIAAILRQYCHSIAATFSFW